MALPISTSAPGGKTSSASRTKAHSLRNGRCSSAQFFFFGQVPLNWNYFGAALLRNLDRAVGALRIDDENFVCPFHAVQTAQQIRRLILDRNDDRKWNAMTADIHARTCYQGQIDFF